MITVTGTLKDIFGTAVSGAALIFQLCGYGSALPRVSGTSLLAKTAPEQVDADVAGQFSKTLYGNDVIVPAGTFYTVQLLDDNGNVVQTSAYQFTGNGTLDLSTVAPYDPSTPYVPPTPSVSAGVVTVPYALNPAFDASLVAGPIAFQMTLTGNVTGAALSNVSPGQIVTFILIQDGAGAHTFAWPANVKNGTDVATDPNAITVQSFIARADGTLFPIGPATVS